MDKTSFNMFNVRNHQVLSVVYIQQMYLPLCNYVSKKLQTYCKCEYQLMLYSLLLSWSEFVHVTSCSHQSLRTVVCGRVHLVQDTEYVQHNQEPDKDITRLYTMYDCANVCNLDDKAQKCSKLISEGCSAVSKRMDGWLGFNGILSTQVATISCLRKFKVY